MIKFDKVIFGQNVKALREAIGISQLDFSILLDISKRSVANIEAGLANMSVELLASISVFYQLSFNDLNDKNLKVPENFRDKIIDYHKKNKIYHNILNKQPNLTFAINQKLLKSSFLNTPKEINEIKLFFEENNWHYLGTSISNALKRETELIKIELHPSKKGTFLYNKK